MAYDHKRFLPDMAYVSAGAVSSIDLPRDNTLKQLNLMLRLGLTTATTAASGAEPNSGILNAIRRLEIVADGAVTLWSLDPVSLYTLNALWTGTPAERQDLAPPSTGTSNILEAALQIPFAQPHCSEPNVTLLNASALSSLQLKVTWGAVGDLFTTVANTSIDTNTLLAIETHEIVGLSPKSIFSAFKVSQITRDITAASSNFEIEFPRGNVLRGILFRTNTTSGSIVTDVDTVINEIRIETSELGRGPFVHRKSRCTDTNGTARNGYHVRNSNRQLYGLNDLYTVETGQQDFSLTGFYQTELMEDKQLTSPLRTQPFSSCKAVLDVSNPGSSPKVIATVQEIVPAQRPRA